ncbi:hypothetical protein B5P43_15820 [Bacillus sp. SRB_336]|nr:hypothetical protein B5P43_15820 [Bacillus sp. SRB_336]
MRNHRRTRHLAVAVLMAGILTACVPVGAQAAEEPVPTASASVTDTSSAAAPAAAAVTVAVGAGEVIAIQEAYIDASTGTGSVGTLAPGESAKWSTFTDDGSGGRYMVSNALGLSGSVAGNSVVALPQAGLKLDRNIIVRNSVGQADILSGFGGKLDSGSMAIRTAPSRAGDVIRQAQEGQKLVASALVKAESNLMGQTSWVAVLLDPATNDYGWLRSEAVAIDPDPTAPETLTPAPADPSAEATDGELSEPSSGATETAVAEVTASAVPTVAAVAVAEKSAEDPAAKKDSMPVIAGFAGIVALLVGGSVVAAKQKRKAAGAAESGETVVEAAPTVPTADVDEADEPVTDRAEASVEAPAPTTKITWGD